MKCQFWNSYKSSPKIIDIWIFGYIKPLTEISDILIEKKNKYIKNT